MPVYLVESTKNTVVEADSITEALYTWKNFAAPELGLPPDPNSIEIVSGQECYGRSLESVVKYCRGTGRTTMHLAKLALARAEGCRGFGSRGFRRFYVSQTAAHGYLCADILRDMGANLDDFEFVSVEGTYRLRGRLGLVAVDHAAELTEEAARNISLLTRVPA